MDPIPLECAERAAQGSILCPSLPSPLPHPNRSFDPSPAPSASPFLRRFILVLALRFLASARVSSYFLSSPLLRSFFYLMLMCTSLSLSVSFSPCSSLGRLAVYPGRVNGFGRPSQPLPSANHVSHRHTAAPPSVLPCPLRTCEVDRANDESRVGRAAPSCNHKKRTT